MKLYIKQKVFSWKDKFSVYDQYGNARYYVEGEMFSFGKKLHVFDLSGNEVAFIEQKVLSFAPRFYTYVRGQQVAEIVKKFTLFKPKYVVEGLGWDVDGSFLFHEYEITKNGENIVNIRKEYLSWGDCYEMDIANLQDELVALAVVLTIDCVIDAQN